MKLSLIVLMLSFLCFVPNRSKSQTEPDSVAAPKFFLDCDDCDFTFVRQELTFVSFVRDPKLADVHILTSESHTGGGGHKYFINFIGLKNFKGQNYDYEYVSDQTETDDEIRKGLLKRIETGILQYYSKTGFLNQLDINLEEKENRKVVDMVDDPWKSWVFRIEAGSDFQKEESQNEYSLNSEIRIEKITEAWKTRLEGNFQTDHENYYDDGKKIVNNQNETEIWADYIKSLTPRWSARLYSNYSSSTYLNTENELRLEGAAEYNIFPWDISNRKVFIFRYQAGVQLSNYYETTIYDKNNEVLSYEAIKIALQLVQPWGTIEASLEGSHYFRDFSKNRLTFDSEFSVRLSKHLSIYSELETKVIHDQLYLPRGNASLEDLLLKRRKLVTTYEINGEVGFRFTFGSMYNSVVNERF